MAEKELHRISWHDSEIDEIKLEAGATVLRFSSLSVYWVVLEGEKRRVGHWATPATLRLAGVTRTELTGRLDADGYVSNGALHVGETKRKLMACLTPCACTRVEVDWGNGTHLQVDCTEAHLALLGEGEHVHWTSEAESP